MASLAERFWKQVDTSGECWLWIGTVGRDGYGRINLGQQSLRAHRVSAELNFDEFDPSLWVLHHCDVPLCVRPDHLYQGDAADNARDKVTRHPDWNHEARKTHCVHGHEFTPENTYIRKDPYQRVCRACTTEAQRRDREKLP